MHKPFRAALACEFCSSTLNGSRESVPSVEFSTPTRLKEYDQVSPRFSYFIEMQYRPGVANGAGPPKTRSPLRSNPIGDAIASFADIATVIAGVRGPDCLDGTQPLDPEPDRTPSTPIGPPQPSDPEAGL